MALNVVNSVPMIAAVAAVGWCVWPYLDPSATPQPAKSELPQVEARLFNLSLEPASGRDPFLPLGEGGAEKSKGGGEAGLVATQQKAEASRPGGGAPGADGKRTPPPQDGCNLGATLIHGRRRAAVINGRVYLLGEMVAAATPDGEPACLAQIERDMVYLRVKDRPRPVVLAFAGVESPRRAAKPALMPAPADDAVGRLLKGLEQGRSPGGGAAVPLLELIKSLTPGGLAQ